MNDEQKKLADEIAEILKDQNLSPADRLLKMKSKLNEKKVIENKETQSNITPNNLGTYGNNDIKKAALRNQLLNKKDTYNQKIYRN